MTRSFLLFFAVAAGAAAMIACVDGGRGGKPVSEPEFYARNVKAYGETAAGLPPDVVYGWDVSVVGDVAKWRECSAIDTCGQVERTRPASELLGMQHVAHAHVDGQAVEVQKLSLAPRPTYVVPNFKPQPR